MPKLGDRKPKKIKEIKDCSSAELQEWLRSNGADVREVALKKSKGSFAAHVEWILTIGAGRGLHANEQFQEGELIMRIPINCLPNLDTLSDLREEYPE